MMLSTQWNVIPLQCEWPVDDTDRNLGAKPLVPIYFFFGAGTDSILSNRYVTFRCVVDATVRCGAKVHYR